MKTSRPLCRFLWAMTAMGFGATAMGQVHDHQRSLSPRDLELPAGTAAIIGTMGFLDYANPIAPSNIAQPPLVTFIGDQPEPTESLLPYQSEGHQVEINWPFLATLEGDGEKRATLSLFGTEERELVFVYAEYRSATSYSWFGQIAGVPASDFILVRYDDVIYMVLRDFDRKEEFEIHFTPASGGTASGHALRAVSRAPSRHNQCGTCNGQVGEPAPDSTPPVLGSGDYGSRAVSDPTNRIDVLFVATADAMAGFGSHAAFYAQAQACVDDFNLASANAQAGLSMRLMHADPNVASYWESDSGSTDLNRLANSSDGYMDGVIAMRDTVRADMVALFRQSRWNVSGGSSTVGVAFRPGNIASMTSGIGFSVTSRLSSSVPATFSHEIGHNLGACHHQSQGGCDSAVTTSPHGKQHTCDRLFCYDYWHTTMAYSQSASACSADTRLTIFSNPNISFRAPFGCSDFPVGDSVSNVAGVIQTTRPLASQWRIASSRVWAAVGGGAVGTRFSPYGRVSTAVQTVQGNSDEAEVMTFAGTYNETAAAGGPVLMNRPCRIIPAAGGPGGSIILK